MGNNADAAPVLPDPCSQPGPWGQGSLFLLPLQAQVRRERCGLSWLGSQVPGKPGGAACVAVPMGGGGQTAGTLPSRPPCPCVPRAQRGSPGALAQTRTIGAVFMLCPGAKELSE